MGTESHLVVPARIAVIASASGSEHAVSVRSAGTVRTALQSNFEAVQVFAFDSSLQAALTTWQPDVVFPVAHGPGETGELQNLLERMRLPYIGSDESASALCWNKVHSNQTVAASFARSTEKLMDSGYLAVPPYVVLRQGDDVPTVLHCFSQGHPGVGHVVVKPAREGSSIGISFCVMPNNRSLTLDEVISTGARSIAQRRLNQIEERIEQALAYDDLVLLQAAVSGVEVTVAVLEDPDTAALPVVEIVTPAGTWYDYEHKYAMGGSEHVVPARLPASWLDFAQAAGVAVHRALGCRDYSRVDFIVDRSDAEFGTPRLWFLECNTQPGFTATSLFPDAAKAAGYSMPDLVRRLVMRAWGRRGLSHGHVPG